MPCCKNPAIPKTSKLGNYFFAHAIKGECTSLPESLEHIFIKTLIAKAAIEAGWEVTTEYRGETPLGEKWVADVFCQKRNNRIALEVQRSSQTVETTLLRQARYVESGIRCCWFLSEKIFANFSLQPNQEVPYFHFSFYGVEVQPKINCFDLDLNVFVIALLNGKVKWLKEKLYETYNILYIKDQCWNKDCRKEIKQVYGYAIDVYGNKAMTVPNASTVLEEIHELVTNEELKNLGLNLIKSCKNLKGNAPNFPYCNICVHCGLPQSNHYLMQKLINHKPIDEENYVEFELNVGEAGKWHLAN